MVTSSLCCGCRAARHGSSSADEAFGTDSQTKCCINEEARRRCSGGSAAPHAACDGERSTNRVAAAGVASADAALLRGEQSTGTRAHRARDDAALCATRQSAGYLAIEVGA